MKEERSGRSAYQRNSEGLEEVEEGEQMHDHIPLLSNVPPERYKNVSDPFLLHYALFYIYISSNKDRTKHPDKAKEIYNRTVKQRWVYSLRYSLPPL